MLPLADKLKNNADYYAIFQKALTEARYKNVVENLIERAEAGDLKAQRLVIEHAQGKPTQRIEVVSRQDEQLAKIQALLAAAGQPVEWLVLEDTGETESSESTESADDKQMVSDDGSVVEEDEIEV